jgi:hypothetical protein
VQRYGDAALVIDELKLVKNHRPGIASAERLEKRGPPIGKPTRRSPRPQTRCGVESTSPKKNTKRPHMRRK